MALKFDCQKFSPNIFNKSKCQNCFRAKEAHSAEALDNSRATRRISKCGYLFVAPDWDFADPVNRTKRWQRRWFVLYDDGELAYSVDEHPETIPQAIIDMTKVLEVTDAEPVTEHRFSIAITAVDKVHFIKGTSREEFRWWFEVLSVFPRNIKGRHKRNVTFPVIRTTATAGRTVKPGERGDQESTAVHRPRFLSCQTDPVATRYRSNSPTTRLEEDVFPVKDTSDPTSACQQEKNKRISLQEQSDFTGEELVKLKEKSLRRHSLRQKADAINFNNATNRWNSVTRSASTDGNNKTAADNLRVQELQCYPVRLGRERQQQKQLQEQQQRPLSTPDYVTLADVPRMKRYESLDSLQNDDAGPMSPKQWTPEDKPCDDFICTKTEGTGIIVKEAPERDTSGQTAHHQTDNSETHSDGSSRLDMISRLDEDTETTLGKRKLKSISETANKSEDISAQSMVRDEPDGSLDSEPLPKIRVETRNEEMIYVKKGWLMKQGLNGELNKYWFVLRGTALIYYSDPSQEGNGILDGILDLSLVKRLEEEEISWNHGIKMTTWDDKQIILSAFTTSMQKSWLQCLRIAANLTENYQGPSKNDESISTPRKYGGGPHESTPQKGAHSSRLWRLSKSCGDYLDVPENSSIPSLFSSDDDMRTMSETSSQMEYVESGGEDGTSGDQELDRNLPPSPPLNRTPISKVKEKARSRSGTGGGQRYPKRYKPSSKSRRSARGTTDEEDQVRGSVPPKSPLASESQGSGLEDQVESLQKQLEKTQKELVDLYNQNISRCDVSLSDWEAEHHHHVTQVQTLKQCLNQANETIQMQQTSIDKLKMEQNVGSSGNGGGDLKQTVKMLQKQVEQKDRDLQESYARLQEAESAECKYTDLMPKYTALRKKLDQQMRMTECARNWKKMHDNLQSQYLKEKEEWEEEKKNRDEEAKEVAVMTDENWRSRSSSVESIKERIFSSEQKIQDLQSEIDTVYKVKEESLAWLRDELEQVRQRGEQNLKQAREERDRLQSVVTDLERKVKTKSEELSKRGEEVNKLRRELDRACGDLVDTVNKLQKSNSDNEHLMTRVKDNPMDDPKYRRLSLVGSLSDLANLGDPSDLENLTKEGLLEEHVGLRDRFERAISEIKALKRELKEAQNCSDDMEICCVKLQHDMESVHCDYQSQLKLMTTRVEDLTNKLSRSEKDVRQLRQRLTRQETKEQRRTRSLKGRESFSLSKDLEIKMGELEKKLEALGGGVNSHHPFHLPVIETSLSKYASSESIATTNSQDGASTPPDGWQLFMRLNALEHKVSHASEKIRNFGDETAYKNETEASCKTPPHFAVLAELSLQVQELGSKQASSNALMEECRKKVEECIVELEAADKTENRCNCMSGSVLRTIYHHLKDLEERVGSKRPVPVSPNNEVMQQAINKLQELMQMKLTDIIEKQMTLQRTDNFDETARARLFAERLAYEAVLISHLACALNSCYDREKVHLEWQLKQVREAQRTISSLEKKILTGKTGQEAADSCSSLLAIKLVMQSDLIVRLKGINEPALVAKQKLGETSFTAEAKEDMESKLSASCREMEHQLGALTQRVGDYVDDKIPALASLLTDRQSFECCKDRFSKKVLEMLSRRLAMDVLPPLVMKYVHLYEREVQTDKEESLFTFNWQDELIHRKSEVVVEEARKQLEEFLSKLESAFKVEREKNWDDKVSDQLETLLEDLADVFSHKSYLDGLVRYIHTTVNAEGNSELSKTDVPTTAVVKTEPAHRDILQLEDEFLAYYTTYCESAGKLAMEAVCQAETLFLMGSNLHPGAPTTKQLMDTSSRDRSEDADEEWGRHCCRQCEELQRKAEQMARKYESDLLQETERHQERLESLHSEHIQEVVKKEELHSDTVNQLKDQLNNVQRHLVKMEEDRQLELNLLRETYEQELQRRQNARSMEDSVRQKYQTEIEQLRNLCEKGLAAMDKSHRRIVNELEDKHQRELMRLQEEKEQALAEETKATLSALDAMRKAHETEVQKEIEKFKVDFLQKMQVTQVLDSMHSEHKEEMENIKVDILSLSEKYSTKCIEASWLEGKLETMEKQLQHANTVVLDLKIRNQQMRSHIPDDSNPEEANLIMDLIKQDLANREDFTDLSFQRSLALESRKSTESKADQIRMRTEDEPRNPDCRLSKDLHASQHRLLTNKPRLRSTSVTTRASHDLMKSPSWPGLARSSSSCNVASAQRNSLVLTSSFSHGPSSGVVASRKQVFENK